jgi:hypothetical protein
MDNDDHKVDKFKALEHDYYYMRLHNGIYFKHVKAMCLQEEKEAAEYY